MHPGRVATERWFLKLDGIAGESTDAAHKGEIDVESWSWGVSNRGSTVGRRWAAVPARRRSRTSTSSAGSARRRRRCSSPALPARTSRKACSPAARRRQGKGIDFLKYKLRDVLVTSLMQSDTDAEPPDRAVLAELLARSSRATRRSRRRASSRRRSTPAGTSRPTRSSDRSRSLCKRVSPPSGLHAYTELLSRWTRAAGRPARSGGG